MATPATFDLLPSHLLSAKDEADAFGRLRRRVVSTLVRQTLSTARFRVSLIVVLTSVLWAGMFWMFLDGFVFLKQTITNEDTYGRIVAGVFELFFAALIVMLVFSSAIILYGSLFRSREITYLMTIPARTGRLFLHKFNEDLLLSSWGFILLGSPMLLAYGIVAEAPWYYYVLLLPFLISFVYIPVAIGAILCMLVVRSFPDHRLAILVGAGVVVAVAVAWMAWGVVNAPPGDLLTPSWFREISGRLQISDYRLLPGWWLTTGLVDAANGVPDESVLFLALIISSALLFRLAALWTATEMGPLAYRLTCAAVFLAVLAPTLWLVGTIFTPLAACRGGAAATAWFGIRVVASFCGHVLGIAAAVALALTSAALLPVALLGLAFGSWAGEGIYRPAYSGLYGKTLRRKRSRFVWLDESLSHLLCWLPRTMRLMTIKDFRLFRRDPLQWSQVLIFGALIVVYFFNVPSFTYDLSVKAWVNMVSFLNLAVVGLLLSTFTTRFIYPMISLEGRRFWILGLLGVRRETVLWNKFWFALLSVVPCSVLVLLSDHILHVLRNDPEVVLLHQLICVVLCFGLAGIAVGFGAWFPNPREDSPSRLAAGFGGTMTLVVSTLYILILVLMTALPTHFRLTAPHGAAAVPSAVEIGRNGPGGAPQDDRPEENFLDTYDPVELSWWGGAVGAVVLGAVATLVPLWIGFRAFRRLEF
jgi:hypothetical protein